MKNILSCLLLLFWSSIVYCKTYILESQPSLYCDAKQIKALLTSKLNITPLKIVISERAGHVDYYDLTLSHTPKLKQSTIVQLIDKHCMHATRTSHDQISDYQNLPVIVKNSSDETVQLKMPYDLWLTSEIEGDLLQASVPYTSKTKVHLGNDSINTILQKGIQNFHFVNLWFNSYPDTKNTGVMVIIVNDVNQKNICKLAILNETVDLQTRVVNILKNSNRCQVSWDKSWFRNQGNKLSITPIKIIIQKPMMIQ